MHVHPKRRTFITKIVTRGRGGHCVGPLEDGNARIPRSPGCADRVESRRIYFQGFSGDHREILDLWDTARIDFVVALSAAVMRCADLTSGFGGPGRTPYVAFEGARSRRLYSIRLEMSFSLSNCAPRNRCIHCRGRRGLFVF